MDATSENYALVSYIAQAVQPGHKLGKKALQKLVHLVSEIAGVPVGYKFRLYTYGPFSRELASDVDILDSLGALSVSFNPERNGYEISPATHVNDFIERSSGYIDNYKISIEHIMENFGHRKAKDLELSSMLTFIIKEKMVGDTDDDKAVIEKFREIKPHYSDNQISEALAEIRELLH